MNDNIRKFLAFLFCIVVLAIVVNFNAGSILVRNTKMLSIFLLSDLNREAFVSFSNFKMFIHAKFAFDPMFKYVILGVTSSVFIIIAMLYKKRQDSVVTFKLEDIFRQLSLVYDEMIDSGKRDKNGKIIFDQLANMPELDFKGLKEDNTFIIKNVHPKVEKNLSTYLKGLLVLLKEAGYIEIDAGMLKDTGFPGQFKVTLLSPELIKRQRLESVFNKANLYFKETIGERTSLIYPKITELENGNLIVDVSRVNITKTQLENSIPIISKEYDKNYIFVTVKDNTTYEIHCSKPAILTIAKGETIVKNIDSWKNGVVQKLRDLWDKEKQFYWYFGDLRDASYTLDSNEMIISGDDLIHGMIIGTSGSGKSESVKSMCITMQAAYGDKIEIYYANGAQSGDLDALCSNYSPIGKEAAKPYGHSADEMLSRLLHILSNAESIKERRDVLFKEAAETYGIECKKVVEYRQITGDDIPEILIVIDEFAGYSMLFDYEASVNTVGSVAYYLQTGFSQYRKFGIHFLIATQEMKAKSIPRRLFSNISGGLVMKVVETDYKYMSDNLEFNFEGLNPISFSKGDGMFFNSKIKCRVTQKSRIPVAIPFIGTDTMELINIVGNKIDPRLKKDYDISILTLDEKDLALGGFEEKRKKLQTVIEKCFLVREKWIVTRKDPANHRIVNLYAKYKGDDKDGVLTKDKTIRIVFANVDEVLSSNFAERIESEDNDPADLTIYFINSKTTPKNIDDIKYTLESDNASLCLFQNVFTPAIREAYEYYKAKDDTEVFNKLLGSIELRHRNKAKKELDNLYSSKISPAVVNVQMLNRIRRQEGAAKKGESFEDFFLALESALGHDSIHGKELAIKGIVKLNLANAQADGGLDIVRWIDFDKKICIGYQLKNQVSRSLNTDTVDKLHKTRELYTNLGLTFQSFFLITTGDITRQARDEAEKLGFIVLNGKQLDDLIRSIDSRSRINFEDFGPNKKVKEDLVLPEDKLLRDPEPKKELPVTFFQPKETIILKDKIPSMVIVDEDKAESSLSLERRENKDSNRNEADNEEDALANKVAEKTKKLKVRFPTRTSFMEAYDKLPGLEATSQKKRSLFNDLAFEFLKLNGYDVRPTAEVLDIPKVVISSFPFVYFIDANKIGVVTVRNNLIRGIGADQIRPIKEHIEIIEKVGYKIVRKEMYLSGRCFSAAKKELEDIGFQVFDSDAYLEEVRRAYMRLEIIEDFKT